MVGVALFLTYLSSINKTVQELKDSLPMYYMSKNKIELTPKINVDEILLQIQELYKNEEISTIDGVKIDFE